MVLDVEHDLKGTYLIFTDLCRVDATIYREKFGAT